MSKPSSSEKGWFKNTVEWAVDIYTRIRPSKLARSAGWVVFAGIALLVAHFNEYLFQFLLKPVGFTTDSKAAPIVAIVLISIGLSFLFLERFVPINSSPAPSDVKLMRKLVEIGDWEYHDYILDRIFNHGHSSEDIDPLWRIRNLLSRPDSFFEDKRANDIFDTYKENLRELSELINRYFAPLMGVKEIYYVMLERIHPDRTGIDNPEFLAAQLRLNEAISKFDASTKQLFAAAKSKGFLLDS
ncbi:MAG: hypothetical protein WA989_16575 [Henriciella sp.]|uniref:hypothetical protein n=1 Tax=Henriciella sp. TaxID=1968823 RepID=UPI003C743334